MTDRLLSCPFCGPGESMVSAYFDDLSNRWRVGCGRCGCSTGISPRDGTPDPAIAAWNKRAPAAVPPAPGVDDLVALVENLAADLVGDAFIVELHDGEPEECLREMNTLKEAFASKIGNLVGKLRAGRLAPPAAEPSGWREIESAPKDGTRVLLAFGPPYSDTLDTGHAVGCFYAPSWWVTCIWAASFAPREPIAWQPLPAPPIARTREGES